MKKPTIVEVVVSVLILGSATGTAFAISEYYGDPAETRSLGPLSEWVPGMITAAALAAVLLDQRRAEALRRQEAQKRTREELVRREEDRRSAAERVSFWTGLQTHDLKTGIPATYGAPALQPRIVGPAIFASNTGTGPAYSCMATVVMADNSERRVPIGTIAPDEPFKPVFLGAVRIKGAKVEFRCSRGYRWLRDADGTLIALRDEVVDQPLDGHAADV